MTRLMIRSRRLSARCPRRVPDRRGSWCSLRRCARGTRRECTTISASRYASPSSSSGCPSCGSSPSETAAGPVTCLFFFFYIRPRTRQPTCLTLQLYRRESTQKTMKKRVTPYAWVAATDVCPCPALAAGGGRATSITCAARAALTCRTRFAPRPMRYAYIYVRDPALFRVFSSSITPGGRGRGELLGGLGPGGAVSRGSQSGESVGAPGTQVEGVDRIKSVVWSTGLYGM